MTWYSYDCLFFFFFKQKTAYEIKECDWSSDVCSSDLVTRAKYRPGASPDGIGNSTDRFPAAAESSSREDTCRPARSISSTSAPPEAGSTSCSRTRPSRAGLGVARTAKWTDAGSVPTPVVCEETSTEIASIPHDSSPPPCH